MKQWKKLGFMFLLGTMPMGMWAKDYLTPQKLVLHQGWEFSQVGKDVWRKAVVPGTVHQDLLNHKQLPDPFYGKNEEKVQWV